MPADLRASTFGLFETLAVVNGKARLLQRHKHRLFDGCRRLGIALPPEELLMQEICAKAALPGAGVIKVIVTPRRADVPDAPHWSVRAEPPRERPSQWWRDGVEIVTCRARLIPNPLVAGLKLIERDAQVRARSEWLRDSIAEGLMLDSDGRLISGTMTNVYAVIDTVVHTPAITRCGVAGVMRAALLTAWQDSGQSVRVCDLEPAELNNASEIFLSNALIGIWPVRLVDGRASPVGPVARAAAAWVQRIVKEPQNPPPGQR
jgi:4-amino-4-deoxychorismate lyase